jgi:hypothetical protein
MELVVKWSEIVENLRTLARYRQSKVPAEAKFYNDHILRGICFMVYKHGNDILWGPSRFVGYKNNSMSAHFANDDKDGRDTNPAINAILGKDPEANKGLEQLYRKHCRDRGLNPRPKGQFGIIRKYWSVF